MAWARERTTTADPSTFSSRMRSGYQADVADASRVAPMIHQIVERYRRIDCAFNNLGIGDGHRKIICQDEATWDRVINTNFNGAFLCLKAQLTIILAQGSGAIVFAASVLAEIHPHLSPR